MIMSFEEMLKTIPPISSSFPSLRVEDTCIGDDTCMSEAISLLIPRFPSWMSIFDEAREELKIICKALDNDVTRNGHFLPHKNDLFRALELTPLDKVRVVIIGQDPYHQILDNGQPRARGLSFSVAPTDAIPSSLNNIYKEIANNYPGWVRPTNGDLTPWAKQGVLLLNSCLTVLPGQAGSHSKYKVWLPFILKILNHLGKIRPNCIYVMWGKDAQTIGVYLNDKSHKLVAPHPSGLSASRGFFGCGHFRRINDILESGGESPIQW